MVTPWLLLLIFGIFVFLAGTIFSGATDLAESYVEAIVCGFVLALAGDVLLLAAWYIVRGINAP